MALSTEKSRTKRKALWIVFTVGIVILFLIIARSIFCPGIEYDLDTTEGREAYLNSLGWEIDVSTEAFRTVHVPDKLEGIMAQYNRMQIAQGYDLNNYLGKSCSQYSYELTNYTEFEGSVIVTLYIHEGELIAGDIHTTAPNGFMHGLKKNEA